MKEFTSNGIEYTWDIYSSQGASFILYPESNHTQKDIADAKRELRNSRDVVSLRVATAEDRDDMYKTLVFRVPATKQLKWYQINQDERLLRAERIKGTSPEDFVKIHVLPFIERTEKEFHQRHGENIYSI